MSARARARAARTRSHTRHATANATLYTCRRRPRDQCARTHSGADTRKTELRISLFRDSSPPLVDIADGAGAPATAPS